MPKAQRGNQRYGGLKPSVYRHADTPLTVDTRSREMHGGQGNVVCLECGAVVRTKKATQAEAGREFGIRVGDILTSPHRVGGGQYRVIRGDALCLGAHRKVVV